LRIEAVVFDMDGVIADTEPIHIAAWQDVLADEGADAPASYFGQFIGVGDREAVGRIAADWKVQRTPDDMLDGKFRAFKKIVEREGVRATRGFFDAVAGLRRRGIRTAVATGSARALANLVLSSLLDPRSGKRRDVESEFLVAREDVARPKPAPDAYTLACSRLGLSPAACLAVEDSPRGIQAAKAAGLMCVALISPFYGEADLHEADRCIRSLEELPCNEPFATSP